MNLWQRHLIAVVLAAGLTSLFTFGREGLHPVHLWNRAFADAAFALVCLILIIGPAARFAPGWAILLPLRRELGIWFTILAGLHVAAYLQGAYNWNLLGFFTGTNHAFIAGNWIGAAALLYAVILSVSSNDVFQRLLGGAAWKLLQQQSYTLFALTILHTGTFLYILLGGGFGLFPAVFWAGFTLTVGMQIAGYVRTVLHHSEHRRSKLGLG